MTAGIAIYVMTFVLMTLGLYAVVAKKNLVKIIIGTVIIDYAVNMLLVVMGYRRHGQPPIRDVGQTATTFAASAVDPLPQAMVLTSIVIGLGLTALMVVMAIRLYQKYGTFDTNEIRRLKG
jgi:multicomponent Na+:H+ antiporter subunit C